MTEFNTTVSWATLAMVGGTALTGHGQTLGGLEDQMRTLPELDFPTDQSAFHVEDTPGSLELILAEMTDETGEGLEESVLGLAVNRELMFRERMQFQLADMAWVRPSISFEGPDE